MTHPNFEGIILDTFWRAIELSIAFGNGLERTIIPLISLGHEWLIATDQDTNLIEPIKYDLQMDRGFLEQKL